ncbi:MAG TPA: NADPH-dependent F420 reductase [Steroidobacteraceae bacterium]|nr:NADPH-dependent F420 reductase [Steroidobacteraceae bacterium]
MNIHFRSRRRVQSLRGYCVALGALALLASLALPELSRAADGPRQGLSKIGIVGAGKMGGTLAQLWSAAGYHVMISSRHPEELQSLAKSIGPNVSVGTPQQAATYGDVIVISVPYGAEPQVGRELAGELDHKVVIDLGNPYPERDGAMAAEARREGTGVASAKFFPHVRLVRAFNAITYVDLRKDAHRAGDPVAIPIASDDAQATRIVERLVRAAGYAPVVVGGLSTARTFDVDTPVYVKPMSAAQLRKALGLPERAHD